MLKQRLSGLRVVYFRNSHPKNAAERPEKPEKKLPPVRATRRRDTLTAMLWLSVDPGKYGCGTALWEGNDLRSACFIADDAPQEHDRPAERWVRLATRTATSTGPVALALVETMRVHTTGRADPADLLDLQGVAAAVLTLAAERGARPVGVLASTWKRQVPRDVMGARIEAEVSRRGWADRVTRPSRKTHLNDVYHAIGLGLYGLRAGIVTG
ncbi:MAG: hypothetical protein EBZ48_09885 [Proteobacteria bacterium]|nr:hypothetical protein [Pseudomonadota bacterium]